MHLTVSCECTCFAGDHTKNWPNFSHVISNLIVLSAGVRLFPYKPCSFVSLFSHQYESAHTQMVPSPGSFPCQIRMITACCSGFDFKTQILLAETIALTCHSGYLLILSHGQYSRSHQSASDEISSRAHVSVLD